MLPRLKLKKKTRKKLLKRVRKLVDRYGAEVVTGVVATVGTALAARVAGDDAPAKKKKKARGFSPSAISFR